jgi:hypothetical protein
MIQILREKKLQNSPKINYQIPSRSEYNGVFLMGEIGTDENFGDR